MKFLCICQYGHSRSVALARAFHTIGQPAVAIGHGTSGDAIVPLSAWADKIIFLCGTPPVPTEHRHKIVVFPIGPDRWSNPYHPELRALCEKFISETFPELQK